MPRLSSKVNKRKLAGNLSVAELKELLAEKTGKKSKVTKKASSKATKRGTSKPKKREVLKPLKKSDRNDPVYVSSKEPNKRGVANARADEAKREAERDDKRREKGKYDVKGKYDRQRSFVKITMHYHVTVYDGGKKVDGYVNSIDEFVAIDWNKNRPETYTTKIRQAKAMLFDRVEKTMESGGIIEDHEFEVVRVANKRELNQAAKDPRNIRMLGVRYDSFKVNGKKIIDYQFIPADLNVPMKGYTCTDSYLLKAYKKKIPSLNQKRLDEIMGKVNPALGRTATEIDLFCAHYKISHYALDYKHSVFMKEVRNGRNHPALIYYCVNGHLYPVTDKTTRTTITKKSAAKASKSTYGTSLKAEQSEKQKEETEKALIDLFQREKFEDIPLKEVLENADYYDCNIFYHVASLRPKFFELFAEYGVACECTYTGDNITSITIKKKKVKLFANMNHRSKYDWNDVERLCGELGIPFINQSLTTVGCQLFDSKFNLKGKKKHMRTAFNQSQREAFWSERGKVCAICNENVQLSNCEIDHILALSQGGDNSHQNLQVLCKDCHLKKSKLEVAERCFGTDNTVSDYNKETLKIFSVAKNGFVHNFAPDALFQKTKGFSQMLGFDITKCRTETALRMDQPWCVYSVFDDVREYKGEEILPGTYHVVTNNYLPFKGTGWYTYNLVIKALADKLITKKDITHYVHASFTLPADYYSKFIEYVRKNVSDKNLAKPIINMFIGSLGHKVNKSRKLFLTNNLNEASYHKFCTAENENKMVHVHPTIYRADKDADDDVKAAYKGIYEVATHSTLYLESTRVPIFNQILDEEAWHLYEITKLLKKYNCKRMVYYNTDNAIAEFDNEKQMKACEKEGLQVFWDAEKKFPKYKVSTNIYNMERVEKDEFGHNLPEKLAAGQVVREFKTPKVKYEQLYADKGSNNFDDIVDELLDAEQSFDIGGRAGCGKSWFLKQIIKKLRERNDSEIDNFIILCPTHKACRSLDKNAVTLHSKWTQIKTTGADPFNHKKWIIIDEKSMVVEAFWKQLLQIYHRHPECKFIICGDWDQLPPVCDRSNFDYKNSLAMWELCDGRKVELTTCRRVSKAGQKLFNMCKDVSKADLSVFDDEIHERSLAYTNSVRKQVNARWMLQKRKGEKYITVPAVKGMEKHTQEAYIYKDLPLIAIATSSKYNIANAEEFRVVKFNAKEVTIGVVLEDGSIDEEEIVIPVSELPNLVQPAYCISVHRSQCATYREPYTIFQTARMKDMGDMGKRLLYVALSRAADMSLINISDEY
jgi:hypothetical protein